MNHNPMQLLFKFNVELVGIFLNPVNAYKNISGNEFFICIGKGNDVGIIIVFQVSLVYFQQVFIGAENKIKIGNGFHFSLTYL